MAVEKLSNIGYAYPVESISRKFALRKETVNTKSWRGNKYVKPINAFMGGSVHSVRVDGTLINVNRLFIRKNSGQHALSQNEIQVRNNFTAAAQWVNAAMKDLSALTSNQLKWREGLRTGYPMKGKKAGNYLNMRGWMRAVAFAIKESGDVLPQNHQLPDFDVIGG